MLGEFPWSALIGFRLQDNKVLWNCGGTLINEWYVVTAANCVGYNDIEEVRLGEWKVKDVDQFDQTYCKYFNEKQKQECESHQLCGSNCTYENPIVDCETCPELQDIKVASVKKHPSYKITKNGIAVNDIMMIKLSRPAVYNRLVRPVCLPTPNFDNLLGEGGHTPSYFKHQNVVVGWGRTYHLDNTNKQTFSSYQQKIITPLLNNNECIEMLKRLSNITLEISVEEHLCAGGVQGEDSCNGDAGGPLLGRELPDDPFTLIGVVSSGTKRCGLGAPTIYTRVSHYMNWILSNMN